MATAVVLPKTPAAQTAMRLGWAVAEARGRNWPHGPRPLATPVPPELGVVLPLRFQRTGAASRKGSAQALVSLVRELGFAEAEDFATRLTAVLPAFDAAGDLSLVDDGGPDAGPAWDLTAAFFLEWDSHFQDEPALLGEDLTNAYLLGRGVAECYWGLGPPRDRGTDEEPSAVSLAFLVREDRRHELTRMLGRLGPDGIHPLSAAAISGSLEAWGAVAEDPTWSADPAVRGPLYEQIRCWYQLLLLGQDPTTMVKPYARLTSRRYLVRSARIFWPQILVVLVALGLITAFFATVGGDARPSAPAADEGHDWVASLLGVGGFGTFIAAGLLARGQSAAQRLVTRLRQDAYTDLVAVGVTIVPDYPTPSGRSTLRTARKRVEAAVRTRLLTTSTPPPAA